MKDPTFIFNPQEWFTPNTYDNNFKSPPNKCGVYLIVKPSFDLISKTTKYEILYVGSSKRLNARYNNHSTLNKIRKLHLHIQFFFKEVDNYIETEKIYIKLIQPKYNKQWR